MEFEPTCQVSAVGYLTFACAIRIPIPPFTKLLTNGLGEGHIILFSKFFTKNQTLFDSLLKD